MLMVWKQSPWKLNYLLKVHKVMSKVCLNLDNKNLACFRRSDSGKWRELAGGAKNEEEGEGRERLWKLFSKTDALVARFFSSVFRARVTLLTLKWEK